jgi:hypothetical protein
MKVIYNVRYEGDFCLSEEVLALLQERGFGRVQDYAGCDRTDPILIKAVEEMGLDASSGLDCTLEIEEINDAFKDYWRIEEYGGVERVEIDWRRFFLQQMKSLKKNNVKSWKEKMKNFVHE